MVRARSPFFIYSYLLALMFGIGFSMLAFSTVDPSIALESWIKDSVVVGRYRQIGYFITVSAAIGLVAIAIVEWKIWNGWEPRELRRMYTGVTVSNIYRVNEDPPRHHRIEVEWQKGGTALREWFTLDPDELNLCGIGDIVHLSAIGKHVANIILAEKNPWQIGTMNPSLWGRISEMQPEVLNRLSMCLLPVLAGLIGGKGIEHVAFQELVMSPRRRSQHLETGSSALILGWVLIAVAAILWGVILRYWYIGWDHATLNSDSSDDISRGRGRISPF